MKKVLLFLTTMSLLASGPTLALDESVKQCVDFIILNAGYTESVCTEVGARAASPGIKGGRQENSNIGCITTLSTHPFVSPPTLTKLSCISNRCRYDGPTARKDDKAGTQSYCITVHTWSESKSFGGGGSARFELCAQTERKPTQGELIEALSFCRGQQ